MGTVLIVIHLILAVTLVIVVLLQRSDGGALGGLGGGPMGGLITSRQSANLMTRTTAIIAACFMGTSLLLAIWATHVDRPTSIIDQLESEQSVPLPDSDSVDDTGPAVPIDE